jgi:hypothetical protein
MRTTMRLVGTTLATIAAGLIGLAGLTGCHENDHHGYRDHDDWRAREAGWRWDRDHSRWDRDLDHDRWDRDRDRWHHD